MFLLPVTVGKPGFVFHKQVHYNASFDFIFEQKFFLFLFSDIPLLVVLDFQFVTHFFNDCRDKIVYLL